MRGVGGVAWCARRLDRATSTTLRLSRRTSRRTRRRGPRGLRGSLDGFASPAAAWAVRYANREARDDEDADENGGGAQSAGFNVWLAPRLPVPHLSVYVGVRNGRATLMADHLPRFDGALHPGHVAAFFGGDRAAHWAALQRPGGAGSLRSFRSADAAVRAVQGPNALALTGDASDADAVDRLVSELDAHVSAWLLWTRSTPLLDDQGVIEGVAARDRAVRVALREHEREAGVRFMGADVAEALANAMAGPLDGARPVEPLARRPGGGDGPSADGEGAIDRFESEVRRFAAAAQRVVSGLPADDNEEDARLRVDVTVHVDLGSFMASKPSLERAGDGSIIVRAHAFLEPEWSEFDRPLAQAASGVYTYRHERPPADAAARALLCPTLCLKLKRREAVRDALLGEQSATDAAPDSRAAACVNELASRWAPARALDFAGDPELVDGFAGLRQQGRAVHRVVRARRIRAGRQRARVTSPTIAT